MIKVGSGLTIQTHRDKTDGLPKLLIFTYSTLQVFSSLSFYTLFFGLDIIERNVWLLLNFHEFDINIRSRSDMCG